MKVLVVLCDDEKGNKDSKMDNKALEDLESKQNSEFNALYDLVFNTNVG